MQMRRLEDYHTTGGGYDKKTHPQNIPRKASGGPCDNATLSTRQYLMDAKFGVIMEGPKDLLEQIYAKLRDPVWGVWFGRKSCIPAAPVFRGLKDSQDEAMKALGLEGRRVEEFTCVKDAESFDEGTDTISDVPLDFKKREFKPRRISVEPAHKS